MSVLNVLIIYSVVTLLSSNFFSIKNKVFDIMTTCHWLIHPLTFFSWTFCPDDESNLYKHIIWPVHPHEHCVRITCFKGTVAWDVFFYHIIVSKIGGKDFNFFLHFLRTLASSSVFGECAKIFEYFWGLYRVNISTMWDGFLCKSRKRTKCN